MVHRVFVTAPLPNSFDALRNVVKGILESVGAEYVRIKYADTGTLRGIRDLPGIMSTCDLAIADLTDMAPFVLMEVGVALGQRKPVVTLTQSVNTARIVVNELVYQDGNFDDRFVRRLREAIQDALDIKIDSSHIASNKPLIAATQPKKHLFISYSHKDKYFLDRLLVHLRPLQRQGTVDLWADTNITAGSNWKSQIEEALAKANIAILLISADFLASDFIVENELPPLLLQAETKGTRIIPVILKPSGFQRLPTLCQFQTINDLKAPIVSMSEGEQEAVFAQIAELMQTEVAR